MKLVRRGEFFADENFFFPEKLHNDSLNTLLVLNSADLLTRSPEHSPSSAKATPPLRAACVNGIFMRSYFPNFFDHERRGSL